MSHKTSDLLEIIKNSGKTVRKISKDLGIPEQRIYGWMNKGAQPKYEDEAKVREYLGTNQSLNDNDVEELTATVSVLISRVSELIAKSSGTSSVLEQERMRKDAQALKQLKSS
jgi:hypothetical protein